MGEVSYLPLIEDMKWSYSRITSFENCPYGFFMRYISKCKDSDRFFSSYGSFMHRLIERYYKGDLPKENMILEFLTGFAENVKGERPSEAVVTKYIESGSNYFKNFRPLKYRTVDVEKRIDFEIDGIKFVGVIDYIGEQKGKYYLVDNKSRNLKQRSNRKNPTVKDKELDSMLNQLYLYSAAVKQEYGKFPDALCFNCFRNGEFIREPFQKDKYYQTIQWAKEEIDKIKHTEEFYPNVDPFVCRYICGVSDECIYYQTSKDGRR